VWLLWVIAALLVVPAAWLWRRARPDGVRRCPACGYDMTAVTGLRCPECGRAPPAERDLFRPRRRWTPVCILLALALACLLATVPRSAWRRAYYAVLPAWRLVSAREVSGCTIREYVATDPQIPEQRIVVRGGSGVVFDHASRYLWPGVPPGASPRGRSGTPLFADGTCDLTGDGEPDLIIEEFSGGAHCCTTYHVVQLGATPRMLATIDAGNGAFWRPTPEGGVEMVGADDTFDYWMAPHVESAAPAIVLRWREGSFQLFPAGVRRPPPGDLDVVADQLRAEPSRMFQNRVTPPPGLWRVMLDLIYSGNAPRAWEFMDRAWNPEWGDAAGFRRELEAQLAASPYADAVRRLNGE
jgi:hypothetical protein